MSRFIKVIESAIEQQSQAKDRTLELILNKIQFQKIQPETKLLFQTFTKLTFITIVNCDLRTLENFPVIESLRQLWLNNNKLQGTLRYLLRLEQLEYIDLSNNIITQISKLLPLKRLRKVSVCINGNPIEKKQSMKNMLANLGIRFEKEQREQRIHKKEVEEQRIQEKAVNQQKEEEQSKQSKEQIVQGIRRDLKQLRQLNELSMSANLSKSLFKQYLIKKRPYKILEFPDLKSESIDDNVVSTYIPNRRQLVEEAQENQFNQFVKVKQSFELDEEEQDFDEEVELQFQKNNPLHQINRLASESSDPMPIIKPTYLSVFMDHQKNIFGLDTLGQVPQVSLNQSFDKDEDEDEEQDDDEEQQEDDEQNS